MSSYLNNITGFWGERKRAAMYGFDYFGKLFLITNA